MNNLETPGNTNKLAAVERVRAVYLDKYGLEISEQDFDRPWGGFFRISPESTEKFLETFYPELDSAEIYKYGQEISPKILIVLPGAELSWQVHERRAEIWKAIEGPVGFKENSTDELPEETKILETGEIVLHGAQTRHRLIGLENIGVVAEIWQHTVDGSPSNEDDNRRIQDNYGRN